MKLLYFHFYISQLIKNLEGTLKSVNNIEQLNVCIIRVPEVSENDAEYIFEEITANNFL